MPVIKTYAQQKELHKARLDIKTLERVFANTITYGTNYSPFAWANIVTYRKDHELGEYTP
jgi:hypothetical protein